MDPVSAGNETRMLAAIVFTDVVGFSKMAAQNEARVYVALQRDLGVMTSLCRAHQGQVLNTMGDGMLLCFMSAVDAMTCALEIQKTLYHQAQTLPPNDVLHHRIGVHLGDVIMSGDNVFGDGVNVAARLQTVAKPGGIAYSATVHDVVRNKLDLSSAVAMGPQQLKNLGQPMKVWQVPPVADARKQAIADDMPTPVVESQGATGFKSFAMIAGGLVLLGGLVGAISLIKLPPTLQPKAAKKKPAEVEPAPVSPNPAPNPTTPSAVALDPVEVAQDLNQYRSEFRFDQMVALLDRAGKDAPEGEAAKRVDYLAISQLMAYLDQQVLQAKLDAPLRFMGTLNGVPTEIELSSVPSGLQIKANGQVSPVSWPQLGAENIYAAGLSLSEHQIHGSAAAPAEVSIWLKALAKEFALSTGEGAGTVPPTGAPTAP